MKNETRIVFIIGLALLFLGCLYGLSESEGASENPFDKRWGKEIDAFKQWDAKNSVPDDAILFVGSSSIRRWQTASWFPKLKLINRGFGGSDIKSVNYFFDKIVSCYKPSKIVLYAGDNDIANGLSSKGAYEDFKVFCKLCAEMPGDVEIIFISIKPSSKRIYLWPEMKKANALIENFCKTKSNLHYADLATCLLDDSGMPKDKLFADDRLHLNQTGYRLWTEKLKPFLDAPKKGKNKGTSDN